MPFIRICQRIDCISIGCSDYLALEMDDESDEGNDKKEETILEMVYRELRPKSAE
jgi:hypothetical protein